MQELKIKTHTTYTYETSDGREFEDEQEAKAWQQALEDIKTIAMFDSKFKPTTEVDSAYYVHIKNHTQLRAFAAIQNYEGFCADIPDLGCWYYDEVSDDYVNIESEIDRLKDIQCKLYEYKPEG
jgi:hypothetical protein